MIPAHLVAAVETNTENNGRKELVDVLVASIPELRAGNEDHLYVVPATNLLQWSVEPSIVLTMRA